jgi:hypothetical protein
MMEEISIIIGLHLIIVRIEPNTLVSIQISYGELTYLSAASSAPSGGLVMVYVGKLTDVALRPNIDPSWGHLWRYIIDCSQALLLMCGIMPLYCHRKTTRCCLTGGLLGSARTRDRKEGE